MNVPKDFIIKTLKYTNNSSLKYINIPSNTTIMNNTKNNHIKKYNYKNNKNNLIINNNFNRTITDIVMNINNSNLCNKYINLENKKTNNTINGIYNNNKKLGCNYKKGKHSGLQKPIILCYDQIEYNSYFVTPKNMNKIIKGKDKTSNKSTKVDSNSSGMGTGAGYIKNSNNNDRNNIHNIKVNTLLKTKNKSFNKNTINKNINNIIYVKYNSKNNNLAKINNYINEQNIEKRKVNIKIHNKSYSLFIKQKRIGQKNINSNSNINDILSILKSGGKDNTNILQNLLKKVCNSNKNSPFKKHKNNNTLKISKTLTEQNILNRMQITPNYYKFLKNDNAFTTIEKRIININSNQKNATEKCKNIKYNNSSIKKNNQFLQSNNNYNDILINLFKHKTQSDCKNNKYIISNNSNMNSNNNSNNNGNKYKKTNNNYGMDRIIKQKLLDRMNNASINGWPYILSNNNRKGNKKILIDNVSEIMKSPNKKDYIDNNTIISNENEYEKEKIYIRKKDY